MAVPAFLLTAGQLVGYAKLFWDTIGKDLAKSFGPDIVKAAWAKFNGDNSQDAKLAQIDKKRMKDLQSLQELKQNITEYRIRKEQANDAASGKKPYLDKKYQKQNEKALRKVEKYLEGQYSRYPELRSMIQKNQFNESLDLATAQGKKIEEEANEAVKAIKEGKDQGVAGQGGISPDQQRFQQYTPEQQQAMSELLRSGLADIQSKKFDFGPIEEEARAGFKQKTIPSIAERFSALGSKGSQRSSAFPQLLSQAGADLERSLAGMKQGYNLQQQGQLANLLNLGLRPQYAHAGPLIGGLPQQQGSNIDKFAEALPGLLGGAGDFISKLLAKKDSAGQAASQKLSNLESKIGGSYEALKAIYPEAFAGKTVLPESYNPKNVSSLKALQALYPQAFGQTGYSDEEIKAGIDSLSGL